MLSRLPCPTRGPVFKTCFATLRTQARTTIRTPVAQKRVAVEKDWHFYGKMVCVMNMLHYSHNIYMTPRTITSK